MPLDAEIQRDIPQSEYCGGSNGTFDPGEARVSLVLFLPVLLRC